MTTTEARKRDAYVVHAVLNGSSCTAVADALGLSAGYVLKRFYAALQRRAPKLFEEGRNVDGDENMVRPNTPSLDWLRAHADRVLDACGFIRDDPTYFLRACISITE